MEGRMRNALRGLAGLIVLCMLWAAGVMLGAGALAEPRAYTYGGSGMDVVSDIAVSDDGRIVMTGYTKSSDGTLAGRTKDGRTGWALCVDTQGNVLWSFCRRLDANDTMRGPAFHEDGSVTTILVSLPDVREDRRIELVRIDAQGEMVGAKTLLQTRGEVANIFYEQTTREGYVLTHSGPKVESVVTILYNWDGVPLRDAPKACFERAERHVLRSGDEDGTPAHLYAVDEQGQETKLATIDSNPRMYDGMLSLADGGAMGWGWIADGGLWQMGLLTHWDAQGNQVFERWMQNAKLIDLVAVEGGYAAVAQPPSMDLLFDQAQVEMKALFLNEDGVQTGELELGEFAWAGGTKIVPLADGSLAVLGNVISEKDGVRQTDACLTIIPKEDIQ